MLQGYIIPEFQKKGKRKRALKMNNKILRAQINRNNDKSAEVIGKSTPP
jgi:hypothetical protein